MSTQGGLAHADACGQGDKKQDFFVDVINGWPLIAGLTDRMGKQDFRAIVIFVSDRSYKL